MKWKANRLAGGKLPGSQQRGEWAEIYFMMLAAGMGMKVSRPFVNVGRYDVGVENPHAGSHARVLRVQVKSTTFTRHKPYGDPYSLDITGPKQQKYEPGTVDFFAILLVPIDDWYIIPFDVIGRTNRSLQFTPMTQRQKYRRYLEAWHLLKETGLTIQACVDEEWEEMEAGTADSSLCSE